MQVDPDILSLLFHLESPSVVSGFVWRLRVCLAHRVPGDGRNSGGSLKSRPSNPSLESAAGSLHWTGHARAALRSFMTSAMRRLSFWRTSLSTLRSSLSNPVRSSGSVLHGPWGFDDVIRFGHGMYLLPCLLLCHVGQQLLERLGPRGQKIGRSRSGVVSPHTYDDNYENETKRFRYVSPQPSARIAASSGAGCCGIVHREK